MTARERALDRLIRWHTDAEVTPGPRLYRIERAIDRLAQLVEADRVQIISQKDRVRGQSLMFPTMPVPTGSVADEPGQSLLWSL